MVVATSVVSVGAVTAPARAVEPIYPECYGGVEITQARLCWLAGRNGSGPLVVILGDSHAGHWWPTLAGLGRRLGLRVAALAKSGCPVPAVHSTTATRDPYPQCWTWRASAFSLLERVRPELVLAASSYQYRGLILHQRQIAPPDLVAELWDSGLRTSLARLTRTGAKVRVLRDLPRFGLDLPDCLAKHRRNAERVCGRPQSKAIDDWAQRIHRIEAALTSRQVAMADLTSVICSAGFCSPVTPSGAPRYRDSNHLDTTFARSLWPQMGRVVNEVVRTRPSEPVRLRARASRSRAIVRWSGPLIHGGAPLTGAAVRARPVGKGSARLPVRTCTTTKTSCQISRLAKGRKYKVSVRVGNTIGMSQPASANLKVPGRRR